MMVTWSSRVESKYWSRSADISKMEVVTALGMEETVGMVTNYVIL